MKMKKFASIIAAAVCLVLSLCMLSACSGESAEDIITEDITSQLDQVKNLDDDFVAEMVDGLGADELSTYGIDAEEFTRTYLEGFDYSIDSIEVNGNTATATVTLKCRSFTGYESAVNDAVNNLVADPSIYTMTRTELNQAIGTAMMDALRSTPVTETDPVELTYNKNGNTWEADESVTDAIANALTTN